MEFNEAARRERLERVGLELAIAHTKAGLVRNKSVIEIHLMAFSDVPWSISGLSKAALMDRAIIRGYLNKGVAAGEYRLRDDGFELTEEGWTICMCRFLKVQRNLNPDVRRFLYRFFKAQNQDKPLREYLMFSLLFDRPVRAAKLELSYMVAKKVVEWEGEKTGVTIKDTAARTGLSYSVIHKQFSRLINEGHIERRGKKHIITRAGKRNSFIRFFSARKSLTFKERFVSLKLMFFS